MTVSTATIPNSGVIAQLANDVGRVLDEMTTLSSSPAAQQKTFSITRPPKVPSEQFERFLMVFQDALQKGYEGKGPVPIVLDSSKHSFSWASDDHSIQRELVRKGLQAGIESCQNYFSSGMITETDGKKTFISFRSMQEPDKRLLRYLGLGGAISNQDRKILFNKNNEVYFLDPALKSGKVTMQAGGRVLVMEDTFYNDILHLPDTIKACTVTPLDRHFVEACGTLWTIEIDRSSPENIVSANIGKITTAAGIATDVVTFFNKNGLPIITLPEKQQAPTLSSQQPDNAAALKDRLSQITALVSQWDKDAGSQLPFSGYQTIRPHIQAIQGATNGITTALNRLSQPLPPSHGVNLLGYDVRPQSQVPHTAIGM